jgi:hypothetical protein
MLLQGMGLFVSADYAESGTYRVGTTPISDLMQASCALSALARDASGVVPLSANGR